jgi:hypothetical protein
MIGKRFYIKIRVGITKGFTGSMIKVLTINEGDSTFDEGFGRHFNPPLKKITPSGPCGLSDGEQILI